jgi:hypothetical protein
MFLSLHRTLQPTLSGLGCGIMWVGGSGSPAGWSDGPPHLACLHASYQRQQATNMHFFVHVGIPHHWLQFIYNSLFLHASKYKSSTFHPNHLWSQQQRVGMLLVVQQSASSNRKGPHTNLVGFSTKAHEEVIRLDVSVQIAFRMHKFYSCYLQ